MKKLVSIKPVVIFISLFFYECTCFSQDTSELKTAYKQLNILRKLLDKPVEFTGNDFGQEVDYDLVKSCVDLYSPDMFRHGIDNSTPKSKIIWRKTRKITVSESFTGKDLLEWMIRLPDQFPQGTSIDDIETKVVFGIYTPEFINHYITDPDTKKEKRNRITAFIIPYLITKDKNTGERIETPGSKAYDLGNLHP